MGNTGLRRPPRRRQQAAAKTAGTKFKRHLPPELAAIWAKLPDPTAPGFLALEAQLMLALQMQLLAGLGGPMPERPKKMTKAWAAEFVRWERNRRLAAEKILALSQVIRQLVKGNEELTPAGAKPETGQYSWKDPVKIKTNEDGYYEADGTGEHPAPSRPPEPPE